MLNLQRNSAVYLKCGSIRQTRLNPLAVSSLDELTATGFVSVECSAALVELKPHKHPTVVTLRQQAHVSGGNRPREELFFNGVLVVVAGEYLWSKNGKWRVS